jgi:hypothetical protein
VFPIGDADTLVAFPFGQSDQILFFSLKYHFSTDMLSGHWLGYCLEPPETVFPAPHRRHHPRTLRARHIPEGRCLVHMTHHLDCGALQPENYRSVLAREPAA